MNYQLMDFFSKTMDLTDKKTIQECTRLVEQESNPINEAEQNTVILSLTGKLYKMIVDKADDIDFGQIPKTLLLCMIFLRNTSRILLLLTISARLFVI